MTDPLAAFPSPVADWFRGVLGEPTPAQAKSWPPILRGEHTLLCAPTGSGKTLAAFLVALGRLVFSREPAKTERCRVLYISPLKALGADVEKNLRVPLAGIIAAAEKAGVAHRVPTVAVRSGDTKASERARLSRAPPDILITTPESLYLLLTSGARENLGSIDTVIIDEIHSTVPTKRGAHLFLSLERLSAIRPRGAAPLQRIGLSATQRPLAEVARLLGGGDIGPGDLFVPRPVTIVDAGVKKKWDLTVELPEKPTDTYERGQNPKSMWPVIQPRLVELIRAHRATMIFTNNRRTAERLASAVNDLAGEELCLAHHGSVSKEARLALEERLKRGEIPAIVATSSLELGLDLGSVDLVVQVESPLSIASGLQRVGRAGHQVGATSKGIILPKFRGDILSAAAATARMREGLVEETYYPRSPLDVLAQQIVAIVSMDATTESALYDLVRRAAPFAELARSSFEGVLDMLSGRYPSDEFAELRPRITWDRAKGTLSARQGAKSLAVVSGGTIPDRGLYGVYLHGEDEVTGSRRVGELDEEMVFESRVGDVFLLGASSWRIREITHDRVLVTPAPGEPGKTPFWHGDRPGRPVELGRAIGALTRELGDESDAAALRRLHEAHGLDDRAATELLAYIREQVAATGMVPSDRTIVVERYKDDLGDYRLCVLSPYGSRVHAPWCTAVLARLRALGSGDIEGIWTDDGMIFRLPGTDEPPAVAPLLPAPDVIEDEVVQALDGAAVFAARFRENAGRALLLPRRYPGQRSPLWNQRKKARDLLAVTARYGTFPILLETYRECLRDVFDLPGLVEILKRIESGEVRVVTVDSRTPSPFAAQLLFYYVGNFIYDDDAPAAERRAQALTVDAGELRRLLGSVDLSELLDGAALAEVSREQQRLGGHRAARSADGLHDLLLGLGDLTAGEIAARSEDAAASAEWTRELSKQKRIFAFTVRGDTRYAAVEDAARLRDGLGVELPKGLPAALLEPVPDPLLDLCSRYARTHGPFRVDDVAARFGAGVAPIGDALGRLAAAGRVQIGSFTRPGLVRQGSPDTESAGPPAGAKEYCDAAVLREIKRRSLARARKAVEPVPHAALARFLASHHGIKRPRAGLDALLAVVEQLEGAPLSAATLESDLLPARLKGYRTGDLDQLTAAGEVVWVGVESSGSKDGRVALFLADHLALLAPPPRPVEGELPQKIREMLGRRGAIFFADLTAETSAFPGEVLDALWSLVWAGEVTNDTLSPLRNLLGLGAIARARRREPVHGRALGRRFGPPGSEGRWSLVPKPSKAPTETERRAALARALLGRHGVLTREAVAAEGTPGGFSAVYDVLKAFEDAGQARRGYFVEGLGATQFTLPGAEEKLRAEREAPRDPEVLVLSAVDPANPYGAALPWPGDGELGTRPQRAAGALVVLVSGELRGYLAKGQGAVTTFLPEDEAERARAATLVARALGGLVDGGRRRTLLLATIDGAPAEGSALDAPLRDAGFSPTSRGLYKRGASR